VGVSAVAPDDIWAVGGNAPTLTEHWDGTRWSVVPGPNVGTLPTALLQVAAVAHNDVWAAGYYFDATDTGRTLIAHWNGVEWSIVPSPDPGEDFLEDIVAVGPRDVWAVGNTNSINTLVLHWDGSRWTVSPSPSVPGNLVVPYGVGAVGADDIWAVGQGNGQTLTERYYCPGSR
jgi:hypothetical protein